MESIGQILKNARLAKRLTIEELQKSTKIQTRYLEALEEDNYDAMPSMFYARTFIRQYANEVGVDADYLINRFDGRPTTETQELNISVRGSRSELYQGRHGVGTVKGFRARLPLIVLILVVGAIIGGIAYLTLREQRDASPMINRPAEVEVARSSDTTEESSLASENESLTVSSSETTETSSSQPEKDDMKIVFDSEEGNQTYMTLMGATKPLSFELSASDGRSWVGLTLDGGTTYSFEDTLEVGKTLTTELVTNAANVTLVLGASNQVSVKVNGQELKFNPNGTGTIMRNINLTVQYADKASDGQEAVTTSDSPANEEDMDSADE